MVMVREHRIPGVGSNERGSAMISLFHKRLVLVAVVLASAAITALPATAQTRSTARWAPRIESITVKAGAMKNWRAALTASHLGKAFAVSASMPVPYADLDLVKSEDAGMIVEAIRAASKGEPFVSAELDLALNAGEIGGAPKLSAQERRVMALYGGGEPVKAVAFQLSISEETAKSYLKRIREKYRVAGFDVGTKVALRKRAIEDGILVESDLPRGF